MIQMRLRLNIRDVSWLRIHFTLAISNGAGRIYQQSVLNTYSSIAFAKLYTAKVPVTAADTLNDRVLPFFEDQ